MQLSEGAVDAVKGYVMGRIEYTSSEAQIIQQMLEALEKFKI